MALGDFKVNYTDFHQDLEYFCSLLPSCFSPSSPYKLANVRILPEIMVPYDDAFNTNYDLVVKKFAIIQELLLATITRGRTFVQPRYQAWFGDQSDNLEWMMLLVRMSMGTARLSGSGYQPLSIMNAGIGGINSSVRGSLSTSTLLKLRDLIEGLNEASSHW